MEANQFWQFSDQLRLGSNISNLSLNDSIWSSSYGSKRPEERRNFDFRVGGELNSVSKYNYGHNNSNDVAGKGSDWNGFNDGWKYPLANSSSPHMNGGSHKNIGGLVNDLVNKGAYTKFNPTYFSNNQGDNNNNNNNNNSFSYGVDPVGSIGLKYNLNKSTKGDDLDHGGKVGKKGNQKKNKNVYGDNSSEAKDSKGEADKRFKTLPAAEALPRNESIGGYIFVCNNDTMQENLKRQLFGLPPRYRDSVRQITPGLPLFLYNYSTHQLHGVYEAASFGGTNIDSSAWEDKKCLGDSRFPAQVRVITRKTFGPLEEDSFRPVLHHYDGPKFRLELSVPEALSLLDIFYDQNI